MGALLRGVKREQIKRGQVIIAPGSMKAVKKFQAQIYVCPIPNNASLRLTHPCVRRFLPRTRVAVTLLSWRTTLLNSSSVLLISARSCRGPRALQVRRRRWSCPVTTWRWFAISTTTSRVRSALGKYPKPHHIFTSTELSPTALPFVRVARPLEPVLSRRSSSTHERRRIACIIVT